jgi:glycosyltransferase involved in cell wall biosynthesis
MDNVEFANLYCKPGEPDNKIVKKYFQITEKKMLSGVKRKMNNEEKPASAQPTVLNRKEQKIYDLARMLRFQSFFLIRELIWKIGKWKTKELDDFLEGFYPDIIFSFCLDSIFYPNVINYCRRKTKAKLAMFFADDIYAYIDRNPLSLIYKFFIRRKILEMSKVSDLLFGASQKLCDEYSRLFGKEMSPLYKICSDVQSGKPKINPPLKITYAGNLYYGRWKTLSMIAKAIRDINRSSKFIQLDIYTSGLITKRIEKALNFTDSSCVKGSIPFAEVEKVLKSSDLVLHVESFIKKEIRRTRLSFSTKIVDCMQSGNGMLAVGPENTAGIDYLSGNKIAIVLSGNNQDEIRKCLENILKSNVIITDIAKRMQQFALENHSANNIRKTLYIPLEKLCSSCEEII